ncbi:uncharacterized protein LOC123296334 [Chrysoperla carnea]|uniref:uncharacterized protein LOC123296334 n=1 Tax=Chrysoperla carnea TaxID=189513 RepID=UPI001D07FB41|nr:uncharacterized protein LOC123296334 [Chrysoperla carnea]
MSGELWHRDPKILYPTVWREFERQSKINKDVIHKFQIRDATTDDIPQILQHMRENFLVDEPLCKILNATKNAEILEAFDSFWISKIKEKTALVCTLDCNPKLVVGVNITFVSTVNSTVPRFECEVLQHFTDVFSYMDKTANIFEIFQTDKILIAAGLSVDKNFRGYGIGVEILLARKALCKALNICVTTTVFTSVAGQIVAKRAGFDLLFEKQLSEIRQCIPGLDLPNDISHSIVIQLMFLKIL